MGSYNSSCYDNDCSDNCCNWYGYCPNYSSTDPYANQCYFYYDQIKWINWFFFWLGIFVFCMIIAVICVIIKKRRNNRQQAVIDYGAGSGHQYNQYVPPNQQNYQPGQYYGQQNYQQGQPYYQNQPVGNQGQYYGNNYNGNNVWQGQNNQPIIGQPIGNRQ